MAAAMAWSLLPSSSPHPPSGLEVKGSAIARRRWCVTRIAAESTSHTFQEERSSVHSPTDYYGILGVSVDASYEEIRKAYRQMQKKHHPDVVGPEGHAMTLLLNEAYHTLTSDELRHAYTFSHSKGKDRHDAVNNNFTGFAYSSWNGPDRPQAIFVDENSCIGCRECVHHANKTFSMDELSGCARVMTQWANTETQIKVAVEACPVNCIHYVDRGDLPVFEYLMRPQPKASNGVYGGGWERPRNIFMAARTFKRKMEASAKATNTGHRHQETSAQRKARMDADLKMRAGAFWWLWYWGAQFDGFVFNQKHRSNEDASWSWKGLFGRSCGLDLLVMPVDSKQQALEVIQEWAVTFASSSELPLPYPFRADPIPNGVQLTLITTNNGVLEPMGSLLVTVKEEEEPYLTVKREGVTGTGALPGESIIIRHLKDAMRGSYNRYHIPRA